MFDSGYRDMTRPLDMLHRDCVPISTIATDPGSCKVACRLTFIRPSFRSEDMLKNLSLSTQPRCIVMSRETQRG
jgi:hypothetical protein